MYLVDTSAWIDYLREVDSEASALVAEVLDREIPFGISAVIYQEILQGARTQQDFDTLVEYFSTQRFFHLSDNMESYHQAALLYFRCRRGGITLRSTIDCLIARLAIEHELILIHHDTDFSAMAKVVPELRLVPAE